MDDTVVSRTGTGYLMYCPWSGYITLVDPLGSQFATTVPHIQCHLVSCTTNRPAGAKEGDQVRQTAPMKNPPSGRSIGIPQRPCPPPLPLPRARGLLSLNTYARSRKSYKMQLISRSTPGTCHTSRQTAEIRVCRIAATQGDAKVGQTNTMDKWTATDVCCILVRCSRARRVRSPPSYSVLEKRRRTNQSDPSRDPRSHPGLLEYKR